MMRTDKYEIAARIAISDLDCFTGKLPARRQRELFGRNIFGKKTLTIDATGQGRVYGTFSVCYGTDRQGFELTFDEIAALVNGNKAVSF